MKVVFLSDLNWEQHLRSVTNVEIKSVTLESLKIPRYYSIQRYLEIVREEEAELVLIAGDVTGDSTCGHGFHNAFLIFLSMLEALKVPSCFISGNHDEPVFYRQVVDGVKKMKYANEISNRPIEINGLKILGVPYETTYSKSKITNLLDLYPDRYDIVIAHAQLKRRIRLFDLNATTIVTGHYDRKHFHYLESTFISLDNDQVEISYATLEVGNSGSETSICIKNSVNDLFKFKESTDLPPGRVRNNLLTVNDQDTIDLRTIEMYSDASLLDSNGGSVAYMKYLRGIQYMKLLQRLGEVKNDETLRPTLSVTKKVVNLQITANYRVSESFVIDYLGKRTR